MQAVRWFFSEDNNNKSSLMLEPKCRQIAVNILVDDVLYYTIHCSCCFFVMEPRCLIIGDFQEGLLLSVVLLVLFHCLILFQCDSLDSLSDDIGVAMVMISSNTLPRQSEQPPPFTAFGVNLNGSAVSVAEEIKKAGTAIVNGVMNELNRVMLHVSIH